MLQAVTLERERWAYHHKEGISATRLPIFSRKKCREWHGTHEFMAREDQHRGGNISPWDTAGGNLIGANIRVEPMSPTLPGDEMSTLVAGKSPPQNDAEDPYDPFNPSYERHKLPWSPNTEKPDGEGKTTLSRPKKKGATLSPQEEDRVKAKCHRTNRKEERVSCKDVRVGGKKSLKTREQVTQVCWKLGSSITAIAGNMVCK